MIDGDAGERSNDRLWQALGEITSSLRILLEDRRVADERHEKLTMRLTKVEHDSVTWTSVFGIAGLMTAIGEILSRAFWSK